MSRRTLLSSVTSMLSSSDTKSFTSNTNESTAALIPKPQEDQASTTSVNEPSVTAATNEQKSSNPTSASSFPPQRDWEAQFAALSSSMGFSGAVPTHPKSRKSGASKVATRTPSTSPAAQSATESPKGTSQSWVLDAYTPGGEKKDVTKSMEALKKLGHKDLKLDEYENIGGLDPIISSLRESVIYPLQYPHLFTSSSLLGAPKGVLLFGPPGCGKTMLAKALAKESRATFINIAASVLTNKWYGESNKLVAGLFSLARKTQPSIVFIDEIDSFLRERTKGDHEVTGMMKAEFMTLWDGLLSSTDRILVLGATNRPNDIDSAILRRMPKRFSVGLPDLDQRLKILTLLLKDTKLVSDFPLVALGERSEGYSGSDLKELCRNAAMIPMREVMRLGGGSQEHLARISQDGFELRPLTLNDFFQIDGTSDLPPPDLETVIERLIG
ncbi:hypothetical protein PHLCEN_2v6977 [Hermanssonia centrifuga]|uniref:AAA+ ATPase domain-containing protein n=1 Tax=Hermanssonia centrifuga TaxID=98765 RepID=A0A2R6NXX4_9APHY|nr:hypothetical protein PHLCEN_2v6977 [Hermanssonia centrifuga]